MLRQRIQLDIVDGQFVFSAPATYKDLLRLIPGVRYSGGAWKAPLSWATAKAARGVLGERLALTDEVERWAYGEVARIRDVESIKSFKDDQCGLDVGLYPFQAQGVHFLQVAERAILADEMGLGKTVQAVMAAATGTSGPVLVICTNSMKHTWAKEIEKWVGGTVQVVEGSAAQRRKQLAEVESWNEPADWYIINWEALRLHSRLAPYGSIALSDKERQPGALNRPWGTVIMDEAHRMKDPRSKQTRAAWAIAHGAKRRYALTGTPVANSPEDIWSIGHAIAPEEYPSRTKFIDRYTRAGYNFWGGLEVYGLRSDTQEELFSFLDPRLLRRTKAEVLPELPPKIYSQRYVTLGTKQRKIYDQLRDEAVTALDNGVLVAAGVLPVLTRLLQAAAASLEFDEAGGVGLVAPSAKVEALLDVLDEAPGEALVVFSPSRRLVELAGQELEKKKISVGYITGSVAPKDRQEVVERFGSGAVQVVLATTGAGGEGITLTAARRLVFLNRPWSAVQSVQAEDRIHRIGQADAVEIIDIIAEDTVESRVHELLGWKANKLEELVRDQARTLVK